MCFQGPKAQRGELRGSLFSQNYNRHLSFLQGGKRSTGKRPGRAATDSVGFQPQIQAQQLCDRGDLTSPSLSFLLGIMNILRPTQSQNPHETSINKCPANARPRTTVSKKRKPEFRCHQPGHLYSWWRQAQASMLSLGSAPHLRLQNHTLLNLRPFHFERESQISAGAFISCLILAK